MYGPNEYEDCKPSLPAYETKRKQTYNNDER